MQIQLSILVDGTFGVTDDTAKGTLESAESAVVAAVVVAMANVHGVTVVAAAVVDSLSIAVAVVVALQQLTMAPAATAVVVAVTDAAGVNGAA